MIKDIAVHLTGSAEDAVRLDHAAGLARRLNAHLTGLQVNQMPEVLSYTDPTGATVLQELLQQALERGRSLGQQIEDQLGKLGLGYELRRLDVYPGQAGHALANEARQSDLFVGTRPYGDPTKSEWIEEAVIFESGRPCLFVPPANAGRSEYRTIMVAWKNTREAARAIADAMPLLVKAKSVVVGIVSEGRAAEQQGSAPDEDIGRFMSRHGVKAEIRMVDGWSNAGEAILNEAGKSAADLIVMGAYGHSRLREWILGGATRDVLGAASIPVFVSH